MAQCPEWRGEALKSQVEPKMRRDGVCPCWGQQPLPRPVRDSWVCCLPSLHICYLICNMREAGGSDQSQPGPQVPRPSRKHLLKSQGCSILNIQVTKGLLYLLETNLQR